MEWTEFRRRLDHWDALTQSNRDLRSSRKPYNWFYAFKIQLRPPYLANLVGFALGMGAVYGSSFFLGMVLTAKIKGGNLHTLPPYYYFGSGLVYGAVQAVFIYYRRRRLKLPRWEDL